MIGNLISCASLPLGVSAVNVRQKNRYGTKEQTRETNATNKEIAQMNNEYNYKMFQEQQEYNREELAKTQAYDTSERLAAQEYNTSERLQTQEYNSASAQRQRLEEAGLNPYLMMNGGSAGTSSAQSIQGASSPSPLSVDPPKASEAGRAGVYNVNDGVLNQLDTFNAALNSFVKNVNDSRQTQSNIDYQNSLTANQDIQNQYAASRAQSEIKNINADTGKKEAERNYSKSAEHLNTIDYDYKYQNFGNWLMQQRQTANNLKIQGELMQGQKINEYLKANLQWKDLQYYDAKAQADLSVSAATAFSLYAQGNCSYAAMKNYLANEQESIARTDGIKLDNKVKDKTTDTLIDTAKSVYFEQTQKSRSAYWQAEHDKAFWDIPDNPTQAAVRVVYNAGKSMKSGKVAVKGDYKSDSQVEWRKYGYR